MSNSDPNNTHTSGHCEDDSNKIVIPDTDTIFRDFGNVGSGKLPNVNTSSICKSNMKSNSNSNTNTNTTNTTHDEEHIKIPHTDNLYRDLDKILLSGYSSHNASSNSNSNSNSKKIVSEEQEPDVDCIIVPHTDHVFRDLRNANISPDIVNISRNGSDGSNISSVISGNGIATISSGDEQGNEEDEDDDCNCIRIKHSDHMDADVSSTKGSRRNSARSTTTKTTTTSTTTTSAGSNASIKSEDSSESIVLSRSDGKRHSITPDTVSVRASTPGSGSGSSVLSMIHGETGINSCIVVESDGTGGDQDHDRIIIPHTDTIYHDLGKGKVSSRPSTTSLGVFNTPISTISTIEPEDNGHINITHSDNGTLDLGRGGNISLGNMNMNMNNSNNSNTNKLKSNAPDVQDKDMNSIKIGRSDGKNYYKIWK